MKRMSEQLEIKLEFPPPTTLPPILSLREFVAQIEREYGTTIPLDAVRAAMDDEETP